MSDNYDAKDIQVLEGLEPVRKRPGMYIGSTDERGLHHLVVEIVDNSIDEALAGYCDKISITVNAEGSVTVIDNGRGIPVDIIEKEGISAVEVVLTKLHAGGKFGGKGYKISGGLHGVGVSVVNALSEWLDVEVWKEGKVYFQRFRRGIPEAPLKVVGETDQRGTKVTFFPDSEIFETIVMQYEIMRTRLRELAFLNSGLTISLEDKRAGQERSEIFKFDGGISAFVEILNKNKQALFEKPLYAEASYGDTKVELAIQYNDTYNSVIYAYANNINTEEGGTHLEGFKAALTKVINDYGNLTKILKDEKLTGDDVREGLTAVISVKLTNPQFEGQTKTKLGNSEIRTIVSQAVMDKIGAYLEEHPREARELILKSLTAQKAREAARHARELTRRKSVLENTTLPGKLADCTESDAGKSEIFLVEGDSAAGTSKQGRDRRFQAILPLRGKILNVEKARINKVLENEEIKNMIIAFGCGTGPDFDESKLRYNKIICMTDADVDGSHIRILLLTFFYRYMRPLVENGHVFAAQPPLYKVSKNKKDTYFYNDDDLNKFFEENGKKNIELQRYKGLGEMNADQLWETTMSPETRTLLQITVKDAVAADEIFTTLMGEDPQLRRLFIEANSQIVKELDI
jgi:DNA gyrase subunit B